MNAISMNFFGSDRAGLTLQLLSPITDRELAWGKIAGLWRGRQCRTDRVSCRGVGALGRAGYWIATSLGAVATFFWSTAGDLVFRLFPVQSDHSKTGAGGSPHRFR
jgi:hypothetical protein